VQLISHYGLICKEKDGPAFYMGISISLAEDACTGPQCRYFTLFLVLRLVWLRKKAVRQKFPQARVAKSAPASGAQRKSNKPASLATTVGKDSPLDWIGAEVNGLRKARGYSLQDLAQKCGKSVGYLSQLERGMSTPTIGALHNVAEALGVQTSWFFPQGEVAEPSEGGVIVRRQRRRQLAFDSGIRDYLLSPNLSGRI
jgi:transcriptional regulator with XRE-family HTH domain